MGQSAFPFRLEIPMKRFLLFLFLSTVDAGFTAQCFTTRFNHAISNADPVTELFELNLADCLNYCILNAAKAGDGCSSIVYHKEFNTCQIYGHDGTMGGAQIVPVNNHDYYNRSSYIGACQDREPFPELPDLPTILVNSKDSFEQSKEELAVIENVHPNENSNKDVAFPDEFLRLKHLTDILDGEAEVPAEETITFFNPTMTNLCTKQEVVSYFVLFGKSLSAAVRPSKVRGIDQSSCIMYCSQNINSTGSKSPCYAANYDPALEECRLYDKDAKSDRHSAQLADDKNIIFVDKFCIQTKKDCSADSPYIVYMHKQITQKIVAHYPDVHSIVACMALCIDHGGCKATTYKLGGLCILHGASPAVDSNLLVDGNEKTMVVENGCQTSARAVPSLLSGAMDDDCFNSITRKTIDNSSPIATFDLISLQTCMMQCIQSTTNYKNRECFSFTYDRATRNCRIFDHDGRKVPAILLPAMNFDFYKKISIENHCGVERVVSSTQIATQPEATLAQKSNFHNIEEEILRATNELLEHKAVVAESQAEICQTSTGYYVVIGNEILLPTSADQNSMKEFSEIEQGDCATLCSKEESPDGEKLKCNSLNYFPLTQKCQILSILAEPHGEGELVENQDSIYAEKFCLPTHKNHCQSDEVFILHVEKRIKEKPFKETISQSITSCLKACLNTDQCATCVFDSSRGRCLLHSTQIGNDLSVTEYTAGYVLIENGCYKKGVRISDPMNWSPWSSCQFKLKGKTIRTRTRECQNCEDFQYEEC
ncbi:unnamed protein product, partial [Mesorhabditis belari]|uniref:Apple domain-containing protein n=1 Tax=Mesorhabditis belari TaxID=2138241 RepID=A0AAF3FDT9_9BILA